MLKKITRFFKDYRQFGFVILTVVIGLALDLSGRDKFAHWLLAASATINLFPLVWGMIEDLRHGTYGVDVLAATAILTSVILGEYWAGMIIVLMLTGGEALEDYAEQRAKTELTTLLTRKPKQAHLSRNGKVTDVDVEDVKPGDRLSILPGEVVPVDCTIIEGISSFDESSLTGESLPVNKIVNDQVLSGSVNLEGAIIVIALHSASDSQYEQIIKMVKSAAASQSPFVRLADRYSVPFTVSAFVLAGSAWYFSGQAIRFLEVMVVATPCPLILGAPIALISGMSRAAKHGIIVKTGSSIERLAEIRTFAFDKTGTLTRGIPKLEKIKTFNSFDEKEVLGLAAALEQSSNHVLAKAIVNAAKSKQIKLAKTKQVKELVGHGLSGHANKKAVLVGRLSLMTDNDVALSKGFNAKDYSETSSFVAVDGKLAGVISFSDEIRPNSKPMLERLRSVGIKNFLMITGDNQVTAKAIAKRLGISDVKAECLPGDKIMAIEQVENHPVAFVGDGVNDAPVLTASDVGIALGARGSTAASESADVVIMLDDIAKVASAVEIAKQTFKIAKQSILLGIGLSLGLMVVFSSGKFKPVYGASIQEVVDVIVIFNALRAHGSFKQSTLAKATSK